MVAHFRAKLSFIVLLLPRGALSERLTSPLAVPAISNAEIQDEEQIARNVQALKNRLRGRGGQAGRRGRGRTDVGSGRESVPGSE